MPPFAALIICLLFVLFLLRQEIKEAKDVSMAVWLPTLWVLLIASKPLGVWFQTTGDADYGSPLDRMALSVIFLLGIFILLRRQFAIRNLFVENIWVVLLLGYMLVSILWSDIAFISLKRWSRELIAFVMGLVVASEPKPRPAIESVLRRSCYILIPVSLLLIKYYPIYGVQFGRWSGLRMWIGVAQQKNGLGRLCMISAFFLFWALFRTRGRVSWKSTDFIQPSQVTIRSDIIVLLIALWILKGPGGAYSATSLAVLAVVIAIFLSFVWLRRRHLKLAQVIALPTLAVILLLGIITPFRGGMTVASVTSSLGRDQTLTGRTEVWEDLIPLISRRPFLGCGFGGFWTPLTREMHNISEAHSGYLEVLNELGIVGLFFFCMFLLLSCRRAQAALQSDFEWGCFWVCLLIMAALHSITESTINTFTNHMMALNLFLSLAFSPGKPARDIVVPQNDGSSRLDFVPPSQVQHLLTSYSAV